MKKKTRSHRSGADRVARSASPIGRSLNRALHKKSWAVIDRPYSLGCATVGALYERPRCIFCAKPLNRRPGKQFGRTDHPGAPARCLPRHPSSARRGI